MQFSLRYRRTRDGARDLVADQLLEPPSQTVEQDRQSPWLDVQLCRQGIRHPRVDSLYQVTLQGLESLGMPEAHALLPQGRERAFQHLPSPLAIKELVRRELGGGEAHMPASP